MSDQSGVQLPDAGLRQAATVVLVDLLAGTRAYSDTHRDAPPILVIATGSVELQLGVAGDQVTVADLAAIDTVLEAAAAYRADVLARLRCVGS